MWVLRRRKKRMISKHSNVTHVFVTFMLGLGLTWNGATKEPRLLTQTEQYFDCFGAICWHFIVWWNPISSIHDMIAIYNPHDLGKKRLECGFLIKNGEPVRIKVRIKVVLILNNNISFNCFFLLAHFLLDSNIGLQGCPMMQYS